jgi:Ca2+-binding RTX toxin-like protein
VANPANANGSAFGGIRAGNAVFGNLDRNNEVVTGVVGIAAANVAVQDVVRIGDINASGTGSPTLQFGANSQFGAVTVAGGDLVNSKTIANSGYNYDVVLAAGEDSGGDALPAQNTYGQLSFTQTPASVASATSKSIDLTANVDSGANFTGGPANDTFNATHLTLTAGDSLVGGAGTDTLQINVVVATAGLGQTVSTSGVEAVRLVNSTNAVQGLDATLMAGLSDVYLSNGTAGATVTGTNTIPNVHVTSNTGAVTVTPTAVTVEGTTDATTVALNGAAGSITYTGVERLNVVTSGSASGSTTNRYAIGTAGNDLNHVNVSGSAALTATVTFDDTQAAGSRVTFDASASTGAVNVTFANLGDATTAENNTVSIVGTAGNDTINIGANGLRRNGATTTTTVDTTALVTIAGGAGTDTLAVTAAVAARTGTTQAQPGANVTGFEVLQATLAATGAIDLAAFSSNAFTSAVVNGTAGTTTLSNATPSLNSIDVTGAASVTYTRATNTSADSLGVTVNVTDTDYNGTITASGEETVTLTSAGGDATPLNTVTLSAAAATRINLAGATPLSLTPGATTAAATIDASLHTGSTLTIAAGSATQALTVIAGAGAPPAGAANAGATVNTITTGSGADNVTGGAFADTIATGTGNDTINAGGGNDAIDAGGGIDLVNAGDGDDVITVGTNWTTGDRYNGDAGQDRLNATNMIAAPVTSGIETIAVSALAADTYELDGASGLTTLRVNAGGAVVLNDSPASLTEVFFSDSVNNANVTINYIDDVAPSTRVTVSLDRTVTGGAAPTLTVNDATNVRIVNLSTNADYTGTGTNPRANEVIASELGVVILPDASTVEVSMGSPSSGLTGATLTTGNVTAGKLAALTVSAATGAGVTVGNVGGGSSSLDSITISSSGTGTVAVGTVTGTAAADQKLSSVRITAETGSTALVAGGAGLALGTSNVASVTIQGGTGSTLNVGSITAGTIDSLTISTGAASTTTLGAINAVVGSGSLTFGAAGTVNNATADTLVFGSQVGTVSALTIQGGPATAAARPMLDFNGTTANATAASYVGLSGIRLDGAGTTAGASLTGSAYTDSIVGGSGNDVLTGNAGNDTISGGDGNDNMSGGDGADLFQAVGTGDTVAGGAGADTMTLTASATFTDAQLSGVETANLASGLTLTVSSNDVANAATLADRLSSVVGVNAGVAETLVINGTSSADTLNYNTANLTLTDVVLSVDGGDGADSITAPAAGATLTGGAGADTLTGGAGTDTLVVDDDDALVDGDAGTDTIRFATDVTFTAAELANVEAATATADGADLTVASSDVETSAGAGNLLATFNGFTTSGSTVEKLIVVGTANGDTLNYSSNLTINNGRLEVLAGGGNDSVTGTGGDDILNGEAGNDQLIGGAGADTLTGGSGVDTFLVLGNDTITDFVTGVDVIDNAHNLSVVATTAAVAQGRASIAASGIASFNVADDTLAAKLAALDVAFNDGDNNAGTSDDTNGECAIFSHGGVTYLYINKAGAPSELVVLQNVTVGALSFTDNNLTGIGG